MKHCIITLAAILFSACLFAQPAQQLPDPHFEDWSGEPFKKVPQPKYWNYSNVIQFGFKFNFAHCEPGRTGNCLLIENTAMKVMGINGGTSPGYVALGQPWTYIPSMSKIPHATAGTYGGIDFSSRPDSIELYIKRVGPRWKDENYNIVFYLWRGQAFGSSFCSTAGPTAIPEELAGVPGGGIYDEESDIRMLLNPNTCGHVTDATEIAEAYFFERAEYTDWHRLCIPIYYLNSEIPTRCNLILSAGHYPAGKATTGLYAENAIYVDDVRLIYASTIDQLQIDGKIWQDFNPHTEEVQTYVLPASATKIPAIRALRGVGTETNFEGKSASFPGRVLTSSELTITPGTIAPASSPEEGTPTILTVRSADNTTTHTYRIQFIH